MSKESNQDAPPQGTPAEARRFGALFEQRLGQRSDAVSHVWAEESVLLAGPRNRGISLVRRDDGTMVAALLAESEPIVKLVFRAGHLAILGDELAGRQMLDDMATMSLMLPPDVPFGHVVDGEIHDIVFTRDPQEIQFPGGRSAMVSGTNRYVLDGVSRPFPESLGKGADSTQLWTTLWEQVDQGTLVRLGERLTSQPGDVWLKWDGKVEQLVFDRTDRLAPTLAPSGRAYVGWAYTEESPCDQGRPHYGSAPLEKVLGDWFAK